MKITKVRKSNELNYTNFCEFGLSEYRVFINLIALMQKHDANGNLIPLNLSNRNCSLCAKEYAKEFNISIHKSYGVLKNAIDKLIKTHHTVYMTDKTRKINICSQADYIEGEGRIDVKFTEEIMPHLAAVGNKFTMYNLCEIAGFESIYTTRFYELLMQWKLTGRLEISISALRHVLGCVNIFERYSHFKSRTFAHAIKEINSQYDIDIAFREIKTGKAVTNIIFTFKLTKIHQAYDIVKQRMRTQLTRPKKINQSKIKTSTTHLDQEMLPIIKLETYKKVLIKAKSIKRKIF